MNDLSFWLMFGAMGLCLLMIGGIFADSWDRRDAKRRNRQ